MQLEHSVVAAVEPLAEVSRPPNTMQKSDPQAGMGALSLNRGEC